MCITMQEHSNYKKSAVSRAEKLLHKYFLAGGFACVIPPRKEKR